MRTYFRRLIAHPGFAKYSTSLSWMLFARIFTMGVSFLTTLYIARALGPTNFGQLDYALAIVGMFGIIASWGIEGVLNREVIKYPEDHNRLVGTACILRFWLGVLASALVTLFAIFSPVDYLSKILLVILSFTYIFNTLTILQHVFYAHAEAKYPSLITAAVTLITNVTKVLILLSGKGIIYLALAMVLESILYGVLYFGSYVRTFKRSLTEWSFSTANAKVLLKTGTAVAFLGVFAMVYSRIDQIMIKHILDATSVGLYSAGVRLVDLWGFIPSIIGSALYPAVLNARKVSEEFYLSRLQRLFFLYAIPAFIIAIFVSLLAHPLMSIIFGSAFLPGVPALQVYIWSLPGTFIGFFVMNVLFTDDYRKTLIFTTALPAVINILLNLAWIPSYGIIGAAWATTISYTLIPFVPLLFKQSRSALLAIYNK
jgi:O-antigen/teichoic acid export membrane protein